MDDYSLPPTRIALILPCFRPAAGWVDRLTQRTQQFAADLAPSELTITVVHDGTPGGLPESDVLRLRSLNPGLTWIDNSVNRGKGAALRQGIAAAEADLYLYTDIDLPYTTASMVAIVHHLRQCGGVAAGERFSDYYANVPLFRRLLSKTHRLIMRLLFRLPVSDSQAGLKGFDESGKQIFLETSVDRFLVDLDFISRCRARVPVVAIHVELRPDVVFTDFGLGVLRTEAGNFGRILWRSWVGA